MFKRRNIFRRTSIPLLSILGIVLTLLVMLAISTYRNVDRERRIMEEFLFREAVNIIRGLEAGASAGMMHMMWQEDQLDALVEEYVARGGLAWIGIFEADGRVVAEERASDIARISLSLSQLSEILSSPRPKGWSEGNLYLVAKSFVPLRGNRFQGSRSMMGRPFWQRGLRGPLRPSRVAVVGMFLGPYLEAQRADIRHAFMMGLVLLILGSASFYFIFVVQNLHLVRQTLRSMTSYVGHVVERMPGGLISVGPGGDVLRINEKARQLLGLPDFAVGSGVDGLGGEWGDIYHRIKEGGRVHEEEILCRNPSGGTIPVSVSGSKIRGGEDEDMGVVILLRDLSEVRALQAQVERSKRLAALGQLAAGVAHELRNPLSSIRGFAQLFKKRFPQGSEDHRYADVMVQEVDRLNRVISNLLDFARPKQPVLRGTDINKMVEHALALIRKEAEANGVEIRMHGDGGSQPVDQDQLTQALLNLLLNAIDASPGGGEVRVSLDSGDHESQWTMEVSDTGQGVSQEDLPRIFDPFFTTKKKGTGLGLAIVHRIVENHRGTIEVQSERGRGTRFILRFPKLGGETRTE